jgi:hypothetical protein
MPHKARDIDAALRAKGFRVTESRHTMYHFYVDGKKTVLWTMVSHGQKEIPDNIVGTMARKQLRLSRTDFDRLIECPLSQAEYQAMMQQAGHIA